MFAVILGFPAIPLLIVGAIRVRQEYRAICDTIDFIRGIPQQD